jgi:hypothetical protein
MVLFAADMLKFGATEPKATRILMHHEIKVFSERGCEAPCPLSLDGAILNNSIHQRSAGLLLPQ